MTLGLQKIFEPVVKTNEPSKNVRTLVCDIFGTLIKPDGALDSKLHDFLVWLKEEGFEIHLASSDPVPAQKALEKLGCSPSLLDSGVREKMRMMDELISEEIPHAAIDDTIFIWLDAEIALKPDDVRLANYLESNAYTDSIKLAL